MFKSANTPNDLLNAIHRRVEIKKIESIARAVFKQHQNFDGMSAEGWSQMCLDAAIYVNSKEVFQLLVTLGANPFFKVTSEKKSVLDNLAESYFSPYQTADKRDELFLWVMTDKESPLFTWEKLNNHQELLAKFKASGLVAVKRPQHSLPIHAAIKASRLDLVQEVVSAAGSVPKAGHINKLSVLSSAIIAGLEEKEHAIEILTYLLEQGAEAEVTDRDNFPALILALVAPGLFCSVKEEKVSEVVTLLHAHGASFDVINPNVNKTLLMIALEKRSEMLFNLCLDKATPQNLNHKGNYSPHYLVFQLFDKLDRLSIGKLDLLQLLPVLKEKGVQFDKTICYKPFENFLAPPFESNYELSADNMSLLHFYVERMTDPRTLDPVKCMHMHLEIIKLLISYGVAPHLKAIFTLTKKSYRGQEEKSSVSLTASEYARKVMDKIIEHHIQDRTIVFRIKASKNEKDLLNDISYLDKATQIKTHKIFHIFRNLERVLAGANALPYSGLPDRKKILKIQESLSAAILPDLKQVEIDLIKARAEKNKDNWQAAQELLINYVKGAVSAEDFLVRTEDVKELLQRHFDVSIDAQTNEIRYGSLMYRLFHHFDSYKLPNSWETLRAFGQDKYDMDINMQYHTPVF